MRIGVSSYSFSRLIHKGAMTLLDTVGKAKEMGFDVIEFSALDLPAGETARSLAPKIRAECGRVGIEAVNYAIGADFLNPKTGDWQTEAERLKEEVEIARLLGVPSMRHDASSGFAASYAGARSFDAALPVLVQGCRMVTEYAAQYGIRTMVENHGFFCQDSERVEKLAAGVGHPNFGILVDVGNFLCADENPAVAIGRLMPYAFHVHAKDFHVKSGTSPNPGSGWFTSRAGNYLRGAIIGHGDVPLMNCLSVMKKANYQGVLSIEFEGMEDPLAGIAIGLENLRRYVRDGG